MKFIIRNQAGIPNKYLRFAKWKLFKMGRKYKNLLYTQIFISKEGKSVEQYTTILKLGVAGKDVVIKNASTDLKSLWKETMDNADRYLRKNKEKQNH